MEMGRQWKEQLMKRESETDSDSSSQKQEKVLYSKSESSGSFLNSVEVYILRTLGRFVILKKP